MRTIRHIAGTAIGFAMAAGFTGAILALVLGLASTQIPALVSFGTELRCLAGIPAEGSACAASMIRAANEGRLQAEEALAEQNLVFTQGDAIKDGINLVVGTIYRDAGNRTGVIRSFCWAIVDSGGLDPRVGLAVRDAQGQVTALDPGPDDLTLLDVAPSEIQAARDACPWPGGTH